MKSRIGKILKVIGLGIVSIMALCAVFLLTCAINNQIQFKKEARILIPPGKIVEVNGHKMHVYSEGKGDVTCVFMAGSGIVGSELEFKGLYKKISDEYRIAVVDRAGYGFSEVADDKRDIDTILEETRKALALAGEKAPYVLFPHSVSGVEAIYWAQKYPEEVKAIIGLDIGLPDLYVEHGIKKSDRFAMDVQAFLFKSGVLRLAPSVALNAKVLEGDFLSEKEKDVYKALTYKSLLSKNVLGEYKAIEANSRKSLALKLPAKTPIRIFLAVSSEAAEQRPDFVEQRTKYYEDYVAKFDDGKVISVRGNHCIYLYVPETIAKESKAFIKSIVSP